MLLPKRDPALPAWPQLWFDKKRNKAVVMGKMTSWRSYTAAGRSAAGIVIIGFVTVILTAWDAFEYTNPAERVIRTFMAWLFAAGVLAAFGRRCLKPFLAGSVFATKRTLVFTPNKVQCGWRSFKRVHDGRPLQVDIRISRDPEAERRSYTQPADNTMRYVFAMSRRIEIVVRGSKLDSLIASSGIIGPGRVATVAELLTDEKAEQFAAVCRAALALTSAQPEPASAVQGRDLDAMSAHGSK